MEEAALLTEGGILITLTLIVIPVIAAAIMVVVRARHAIRRFYWQKEQEAYYQRLQHMTLEELQQLNERRKALVFTLSNNELAGVAPPADTKGLIDQIMNTENIRFVRPKKKSPPRPFIEPNLSRLILWYLGCSVFWLLFGTSVGEYVGLKFVAPDIDHLSWLSFGQALFTTCSRRLIFRLNLNQ